MDVVRIPNKEVALDHAGNADDVECAERLAWSVLGHYFELEVTVALRSSLYAQIHSRDRDLLERLAALLGLDPRGLVEGLNGYSAITFHSHEEAAFDDFLAREAEKKSPF